MNADERPEQEQLGNDEMNEPNNEAVEGAEDAHSADCFDPDTCCDRYEQMMIRAMRAVLRPDEAPECLYEKLRMTLDACCGGTHHVTHTVIAHTVIHHNADGR